MNPILPYEQRLADKVQQVTVPDMADSIWATIEKELDKDIPGDDGGNEPSSPKGGSGSPMTGLYTYVTGGIVIGAILLTYLLTNTKKETTNTASPTLTIPQENIQQQVNNDSNTISPVKNNPASVLYNDVIKKDSNPILPPFQQTIPFFDSLVNQQASRIQADSSGNKINSLVNTVSKPDSIAIDKGVPPKKSKGVKGITDDDYKIKTEKKDSTP